LGNRDSDVLLASPFSLKKILALTPTAQFGFNLLVVLWQKAEENGEQTAAFFLLAFGHIVWFDALT
jgi:hypothetical protein